MVLWAERRSFHPRSTLFPFERIFSPPAWKVTRIVLGLSATLYLSTRTNVHGDSGPDDNPGGSPKKPFRLPEGSFMETRDIAADTPFRTLGGKSLGITLHSYQLFDDARNRTVQARVASDGPRTLISVFEGDLLSQLRVGDYFSDSMWLSMRLLFSPPQDPSDAHPVDTQVHRPLLQHIHDSLRARIMAMDDGLMISRLKLAFSSPSKHEGVEWLGPLDCSSYLIAAFYEADIHLLHVASVGNMRALLGRPRAADPLVYDVHVLSADHTPDNPAEKSRIERLHPGEDVIQDGKLFGRPYTRAMFDAPLKMDPKVPFRIHKDYLGPPPDPRIKTPPYITAEPEITSIHIRPGDFLVLSSNLLAECLTDEEVVGLVATYREREKSQDSNSPAPDEVITPDALPVQLREDKTVMYKRWNTPKRFVTSGNSAAGNLMLNALGGADEDLHKALTSPSPPGWPANTKDMAIMVVFFE
ncbi:phosphatase 2C-domain-containing protein [Mycena latifolia]|nr:phosphatase 2C-domain-containing protein [Mycena latifolia]